MDECVIIFDPKVLLEIGPTESVDDYRLIWTAVIEQAFIDASCTSRKARDLSNKKCAIEWLTGNSKAFEDVCLKAGLDAERVRQEALRLFGNIIPIN